MRFILHPPTSQKPMDILKSDDKHTTPRLAFYEESKFKYIEVIAALVEILVLVGVDPTNNNVWSGKRNFNATDRWWMRKW